jgi:hypothetical protein
MRLDLRTTLFAAAVALPANALTAYAVSGVASDTLASVESLSSISDPAARSAAYFTELGKVLTNPRCLNCHPAGDRPRQGDTARLHQPPVERGADGFGLPAMRCPICHQAANFGIVPGNQIWHLAPREMAWEGKTVGESAPRSRIPRATAPGRWRVSWSISARTIWLAGRGRRAWAARQRQARKSKRAPWSRPGSRAGRSARNHERLNGDGACHCIAGARPGRRLDRQPGPRRPGSRLDR